MNLNRVFLIGRLTRDPEMKMLPSGQAVVNFGLATDRYFTDKSGQKREEVDFHNIVMFGKLAETASQYLKKGSLSFFEGRIKTRSWQDSSGNKKYRTEIIVQAFQMGPRSTQKVTSPGIQEKKEEKKEEAKKEIKEEDIPIIDEGKEIAVKDIPF